MPEDDLLRSWGSPARRRTKVDMPLLYTTLVMKGSCTLKTSGLISRNPDASQEKVSKQLPLLICIRTDAPHGVGY